MVVEAVVVVAVAVAVAARHLEPRHLGEDVEDVHLLVHRDDAELDEEPDDEVAHLQQRALERRVRALAVLPRRRRQRRRRQHRRKDDILRHVEERLAVAPREQGEQQLVALLVRQVVVEAELQHHLVPRAREALPLGRPRLDRPVDRVRLGGGGGGGGGVAVVRAEQLDVEVVDALGQLRHEVLPLRDDAELAAEREERRAHL